MSSPILVLLLTLAALSAPAVLARPPTPLAVPRPTPLAVPPPTPLAVPPPTPLVVPRPTPLAVPPPNPLAVPDPLGEATWCVASPDAPDSILNILVARLCNTNECSSVNFGGPCFLPDTPNFHASYVFDVLYKAHKLECLQELAILTNVDPSTDTCKFP